MLNDFFEKVFMLVNYIKKNKTALLIILSIYLLVNINISLAEFPYIDDIGRQLSGYTGFSQYFSRYLSEASSRFIQGGKHLTDSGLTSNLISAFILSSSSLIVLFVISPSKRVTPLLAISSTILGLNPWFLEPLSFRFDNPFMSLSVLVCIIPFIFWKNYKLFIPFSVFGIYLMCNSYQGSSGVYILMATTMILLEIIDKSKINIRDLICSIFSYIGGMGFYKLQMFIVPPLFGDQGKLPSISELPSILISNSKGYLTNIYVKSYKVWTILFALIVLLLIIELVLRVKRNKFKGFLFVCFWLVFGSVFSYGSYLLLSEPYYLMRPRYGYGFGIFVSIILVILLGNESRNKFFTMLKSIISATLIFYLLSFTFIYVDSLKQQNNFFQTQSTILASSLNKYLTPENKVVNMNRFIANSPIYDNTSSVYPMISSLIMPNSNISWDMTMRFNSITKLDVEIKPFDESKLDGEYQQLETTKLYDIYSKDKELFVVMK